MNRKLNKKGFIKAQFKKCFGLWVLLFALVAFKGALHLTSSEINVAKRKSVNECSFVKQEVEVSYDLVSI